MFLMRRTISNGRFILAFFRLPIVACRKEFDCQISNSCRSLHRFDYTFKAKILNFFASDTSYQKICMLQKPVALSFDPCHIPWEKRCTTQLISAMSTEEVVQMLNETKSQNPIPNRLLDQILAARLSQSSIQERLLLSYAAMNVFREQMRKSTLYHQLLELMPNLAKSCASYKQLIFLSFLCALNKKDRSATEGLRCIYQCFDKDIDLGQLTFMEMSILCNSLFIGGVKVSTRFLKDVERFAIAEIEANGITSDSLPLIKVMRQAEYSTHHLLQMLTSAVMNIDPSELNLALLAHVLAMLADNRCLASDELIGSLLQSLETCMQIGKSVGRFAHPTEGIRAKDVTRFLWGLTCIRPAVTSLPISTASRVIESLVQHVGVLWAKDLFVNKHLSWDFLLSLATWQIYPKSLIEKIFTDRFVAEILELKAWQKQSRRLSLLVLFIEAVRIEAPHVQLPAECQLIVDRYGPVSGTHLGLKKRMYLIGLHKLLRQHAHKEDWQDVRCDTTLVPNVAGVTFTYHGQRVAVEMLDCHVWVSENNTGRNPEPNRYLSLKIRLMTRLGFKVVVLTTDQFRSCTDEEQLISAIRNELSRQS